MSECESKPVSRSSRSRILAIIALGLVGGPAAFLAVFQGHGGWLTLVGAVLIFGVATGIALLLQSLCLPGPRSLPVQRYLARFLPAMFAYVVVLFGSLWIIRNLQPQGAWLWVLGVAPALPIIAAIAVMGLYLTEETDEFQRAILVQSMLWGIGVTMAVCTAWGFLENVGLIPHLPLYLVFPMFCAGMGIAQPFVRRRYG